MFADPQGADYTYRHEVVRELAWSIASPVLLAAPGRRTDTPPLDWSSGRWCGEQVAAAADWLRKLDRDPSPVRLHLEHQRDRRLGGRFESLIEFWLTASPSFEVLHRGLQVRAEGRTLGEFDFLVVDKRSGQIEHWEVAAKFYLGVADEQGAPELTWIGPGKRDSLLRKFDHLQTKQLRLAHAADEFLRKRDIHVERTRALVKGRLYYPLRGAQHRLASTINPDHERGVWCRVTDLADLDVRSCVLLGKEQWLDPLPAHDDVASSASLESLHQALRRAPQCLDVVRCTGERLRLFVVPDGW